MIEALAAKNYGKSRDELIAATGMSEGGGVSKILSELIASGFVREYHAFRKKRKDRLYQLIDPFTLFCLRFGINLYLLTFQLLDLQMVKRFTKL